MYTLSEGTKLFFSSWNTSVYPEICRWNNQLPSACII